MTFVKSQGLFHAQYNYLNFKKYINKCPSSSFFLLCLVAVLAAQIVTF